MDFIKIRFGGDLNQIDSSPERTLGSIEDLFRSVNPMFKPCDRSWTPDMDVFETADEFIVLADVAGADKENLDVEINPRTIRVSGVRTGIPRFENAKYRLAEIHCGRFERSLVLPVPIDTAKVKATYTDGLLQVRLGKQPVDRSFRVKVMDG